MASNEGGRWDVGAKDNAVYVSRISGDDEKVFEDLLSPAEARDLAGLLTKYADKSEKSEKSEDAKDSKDSDDSKDSKDSDDDDSDDSDDSKDSKDSEKSKD
ncbi:MAG: hypothetical protein JOZ00_02700 [Mycobacterium sp.]|uniref:hypothetical protein n=1 Tax=Mycobacterium sp. TaxID=1785 RepID=UPI001EB10BF7|nr:hypothetical protein [Mycobacterium sp.]MBV8785578.1 hypothetical protein [Mycobacterium sp.]